MCAVREGEKGRGESQLMYTGYGYITYPLSTAIAKFVHGQVDIIIKYLYQFSAIFIHPRCLLVEEPGIIKH